MVNHPNRSKKRRARPRPQITIQVGRLSDWDVHLDAPAWLRAAIWSATADPVNYPEEPRLCSLCRKEHGNTAPLVAAIYLWPDEKTSDAVFCPSCSEAPNLDARLVHQILDQCPDHEVTLLWVKPGQPLAS